MAIETKLDNVKTVGQVHIIGSTPICISSIIVLVHVGQPARRWHQTKKSMTPSHEDNAAEPVALLLEKSVKAGQESRVHTLEALAMDNGRTTLVILLLGDPHLLEGGERGQNGTTDPDRVLALRRSNDLDLHRRRSQRGDFLLHAVRDARVHGSAARLFD